MKSRPSPMHFEINGCRYALTPEWRKRLAAVKMLTKTEHMRMLRPAVAEFEKRRPGASNADAMLDPRVREQHNVVMGHKYTQELMGELTRIGSNKHLFDNQHVVDRIRELHEQARKEAADSMPDWHRRELLKSLAGMPESEFDDMLKERQAVSEGFLFDLVERGILDIPLR